jgi:GTP cyclohydrolase I
MTTFENEGSKDEMIVVSNIPFFSLCEHHLAPFFGTASIAYIPNDKIVGLSKLPRTLDKFSRRPQNQERITHDVAQYLMDNLNPKGVGVILKARHLCVEMRGVKKHDCYTTTSAMRGCFNELNCRQEFLRLSNL